MKKTIKTLQTRNAKMILVVLLVLNGLGIFAANALQGSQKSEINGQAVEMFEDQEQSIDYADGSWKVLSWSYRLLQYFRGTEASN